MAGSPFTQSYDPHVLDPQGLAKGQKKNTMDELEFGTCVIHSCLPVGFFPRNPTLYTGKRLVLQGAVSLHEKKHAHRAYPSEYMDDRINIRSHCLWKKCLYRSTDICISKNRGILPPKRMVKIMENPMNKWMIWGYHYFWKHPDMFHVSPTISIVFCILFGGPRDFISLPRIESMVVEMVPLKRWDR